MRPTSSYPLSGTLTLVLRLVSLAAVLAAAQSAPAQQPAQKSEESISGFEPHMPIVRPSSRGEVDSLLKSLSTNDAMFEVIVGQGRLMTLNVDIVAQGKPAPLLAVGDPSVIAAELIGIRQIRVIGERIGVTDLAITTPDGRTYTFEVQVVADLVLLRAQLNAVFPKAENLKVQQIRDHIVVSGRVPTEEMKGQVTDTIKAYLDSIKTSQARRIKGQTKESDGRVKAQPPGKAKPAEPAGAEPKQGDAAGPAADVTPDQSQVDIEAQIASPQIINLIEVPEPPPPPDPLNLLEFKLKEKFPDASLKLQWVGDFVAVEGQARDSTQVGMILQAIEGFLSAISPPASAGITATRREQANQTANAPESGGRRAVGSQTQQTTTAAVTKPRVINLIRVPGPQQVLLKVEVAELNRTALRQIGMSWFFNDQITFIGSNVSGAVSPFTLADGRIITNFPHPTTTIAGNRLTDNGGFQYWIDALRRNSMLRVLAEPNLVAMNGHAASFNAGGEFPVPVPQSGAGGGAAVITIEYKKFGVGLDFVPTIIDGETIRLSVDPVVSSIDFDLGIQLQGFRVPGLNSRTAHTVVELRQGQTLAIAGLMQLELSGNTTRIPGLGDLPILGPFFSNNTGQRVEKELLVLVTPYLIEPMNADQVPCKPGDEIKEPNDLEFYLLGRIEGRTGSDFRATTKWDDPLHFVELLKLENRYISGPCGFSN